MRSYLQEYITDRVSKGEMTKEEAQQAIDSVAEKQLARTKLFREKQQLLIDNLNAKYGKETK